MSIPANSLWRGCAAKFPQPVSDGDKRDAQLLVETVYYFNCHIADPPLHHIEYRSSSGEEDILRNVFRWDLTPYQEVFNHGFQARRQEDSPDEVYYNLDHYVHHGGRPLDSRQPATHAFLSTTLNSGWHPTVTETVDEGYRYEIYAPGGIWVAQTLGDRYRPYSAQDEVCFVAGIAPQYIRSAQCFKLIPGRRPVRVDNDVMKVNGYFDPQSCPSKLLHIERPIFDYLHGKDPVSQRHNTVPLPLSVWPPERNTHPNMDWYARDVDDWKSYINAAFRSSRTNEAYLFMKNEYVLLDYSPGTASDRVLKGPHLICYATKDSGFPSLQGTAFAEHGIDCAFGSHNQNEAFIFSGNLCAQINYAPHTQNSWIITGPMTITAMFPFFSGTVFKSSVDAAFESTERYQAYLFKDKQYALINYDSGRLIQLQLITDGFPYLKRTIFESGIDAAFASHVLGEAYLFKGRSYARIKFYPPQAAKIIDGVKTIGDNWASLQSILPPKNRGLDVHSHASSGPDNGGRDQN